VEGHERRVIAGNDWQRFRPRIVVVEATRPMTSRPAWMEWEHILLEADYVFVFFDGLNRFYVRAESRELRQYFGAPANVFDGFVSSGVRDAALMRTRLEHLRSVISQVSTRLLPELADAAEPEAMVQQVLDLASAVDQATEALAVSKVDAVKARVESQELDRKLA